MSTKLAPVLLLLAAACASAPPPAPPVDPVRHATATNGAVQLEYWVRAPEKETGAPVLLVPGMTNAADGWLAYESLIEPLIARGHRVIAVSLRGRGTSASPETGWTAEDHAGDIAAVLAAEKVTRVHVIAHSMGVAYALTWAAGKPDQVATFTAGDYLPLVIRVTENWVAMIRGNVDGRMKYDRKLAQRVFDEQGPALGKFGDDEIVRDLRPTLEKLPFAVLVLLGVSGQPEALVALHEGAWKGLARGKVVRVESGHDVYHHADAVAATLANIAAAQ